MANSFFAMLGRMKYITRWGLMHSTRRENLSEHSLEVAYLAHALTALANRRLGKSLDPGRAVLYALYHDCGEILTGDLPTPVKYHDETIRAAYKAVEEQASARLLEKLPPDLRQDKLSALIKCQEEKNSGNREFDRAWETTLASLREMGLPEADLFLEEFFPAYAQTLDEQTL